MRRYTGRRNAKGSEKKRGMREEVVGSSQIHRRLPASNVFPIHSGHAYKLKWCFRKSCGLKAIHAENPGGLQAAFQVPYTAASGSTDANALTRRLYPKSRVALENRHSNDETTLKFRLPGGARGLGGLAAKSPKVRISHQNLPTRYPEDPLK